MELRNLVGAANKYLAKVEVPDARILKVIGEYITKILKCFGCIEGDELLGFPKEDSTGSIDKDTLVAPYLQVRFSEIRSKPEISKETTNRKKCFMVLDHFLVLTNIP